MTDNSKLYIALSATTAAVGVASVLAYFFRRGYCKHKAGPINHIIRKDEKKVTDVVDVEDLLSMIKPGGKISFCRCWKSQDWPYCDGVHKEHNKCTGDNVGALNIVRKKTSTD
ncbi:unnamed protein product [Candidula unifasciata]|uniref:Iron-binding zinc finger CDGSH type domain-containing protein n=1 Tax=Candidula unifasciata TaxID=100452 RepID=A0A8S3ZHK9_9EUPU|nr:unnamed protein product [Candidula unifasciata]